MNVSSAIGVFDVDDFIRRALAEDVGDGDHTTLSTIPAEAIGKARLLVKQEGILAGVEVARKVFEQVDRGLNFNLMLQDGAMIQPGDIAFYIEGPSRSITIGERLALNFMQRMSGIATISSLYLQEVEGKLGKYHELGVRLWWQTSERNLPEFSMAPLANAQQQDKQLRLMADYKFKKGKYELQSRTGIFRDEIIYSDILNGLSQTKGHQLTQFIDQFWHGKKFEWLLSGMVQKLNGEGNLFQNGNNFSFIQWQDRQAIFGSIKHQNFNGKLQQQLSLRSEWVNGKRVPLMPSCGLQLFIHKSLTVLGNASSSYRLPTFNDLYWPQMGNPFLKPEQGMSFELSLKNNTTFLKPIQIKKCTVTRKKKERKINK
jgi:hypothetical protein